MNASGKSIESGIVFMIPMIIAPESEGQTIPKGIREVIKSLDLFAVENIRTARRFISSLNLGLDIQSLEFVELGKRTDRTAVNTILSPVMKGRNIGVMSESGCPGVADPGSLLVESAHQSGLIVRVLSGPSSIMLALMGSGMNGQNFRFCGYLPVETKALRSSISELEALSKKRNETQIFIETPYRNDRLLKSLLSILAPETRLCIAIGLTGSDEYVVTRTVRDWARSVPIIGKIPTVFLIHAG